MVRSPICSLFGSEFHPLTRWLMLHCNCSSDFVQLTARADCRTDAVRRAVRRGCTLYAGPIALPPSVFVHCMTLPLNFRLTYCMYLIQSVTQNRKNEVVNTRQTSRVVSVYLIKEVEMTFLILSKGEYIVVAVVVVRCRPVVSDSWRPHGPTFSSFFCVA